MAAREINSPAFISSACLTAEAELEMARGGEMKIIHHTEASLQHGFVSRLCLRICLCVFRAVFNPSGAQSDFVTQKS